MTCAIAPSLQTLQHHLASTVGGPKLSMDCQKESPDEWIFNGSESFSAVSFTFSMVSENSRPVSANSISKSPITSRTRRSVARLSFPPEYETVTGLFEVSTTFFMKLCAFSSLFLRIFMFAWTASFQVLVCADNCSYACGLPFQRVFTAMPFS